MNEAERKQRRKGVYRYLLCVVAFRWVRACVAALLLPYNTVPSVPYKTANKHSKHPCMKYMTSTERERKRCLPVLLFHSMARPFAQSFSPSQTVIPYLGEGQEGKREHVTG